MTIKEVLRLYPSVPMLGRVAEYDTKISMLFYIQFFFNFFLYQMRYFNLLFIFKMIFMSREELQ